MLILFSLNRLDFGSLAFSIETPLYLHFLLHRSAIATPENGVTSCSAVETVTVIGELEGVVEAIVIFIIIEGSRSFGTSPIVSTMSCCCFKIVIRKDPFQIGHKVVLF